MFVDKSKFDVTSAFPTVGKLVGGMPRRELRQKHQISRTQRKFVIRIILGNRRIHKIVENTFVELLLHRNDYRRAIWLFRGAEACRRQQRRQEDSKRENKNTPHLYPYLGQYKSDPFSQFRVAELRIQQS